MKKDQYIPHEVSMRNTSEVMNLIEKEGMEGYGIYWALMEYLRTQDDYIGDIEVLKSLARQLRVRLPKLKRIMENYRLFSCTETTFLSPKLVEVMKPFEDRRARIEAYKRNKQKENLLEISDISSNKGDIESFEGKGKGEGKGKVTTSKEEKKVDDAVVVTAPPVILAWERYVDELRHEQSWIEIMAMRSGLGMVFVNRFPEVLRHFKRHIQAVGNEKDIQSSSDAKRYFNNFNTPGSTTFQKLVDELQKPVDKGKYKYEDRDPATGQRSYCGLPIPADAPPRPNNQAVWCEDKWVF